MMESGGAGKVSNSGVHSPYGIASKQFTPIARITPPKVYFDDYDFMAAVKSDSSLTLRPKYKKLGQLFIDLKRGCLF